MRCTSSWYETVLFNNKTKNYHLHWRINFWLLWNIFTVIRLVACCCSLLTQRQEDYPEEGVNQYWQAEQPVNPVSLLTSAYQSLLCTAISAILPDWWVRNTSQDSLNLTLSIKQFFLNIVLHCDIILTKHSWTVRTFYQGKTKLLSHYQRNFISLFPLSLLTYSRLLSFDLHH